MSARTAAEPRVAFQGDAGAYSEEAVVQRWGHAARPLPARTFAAALARVVEGHADCAVIPVWNTSVGSVRSAIAALEAESARTMTVEELVVPVRHCLLALPAATMETVRHVASHPMALAQCARFLAALPGLRTHEAYDTGGAAGELAMLGLEAAGHGARDERPWYDGLSDAAPGQLAVIASARAAARYGLRVLRADIQDDAANATHFAVVRPREIGRW